MKFGAFYILLSLVAGVQAFSVQKSFPGPQTPDPCWRELKPRLSERPFKKVVLPNLTILVLKGRMGEGKFGPYYQVEGTYQGEVLEHAAVALYLPEKYEEDAEAFAKKVELARKLGAAGIGPKIIDHFEYEGTRGILYQQFSTFRQDLLAPVAWHRETGIASSLEFLSSQLEDLGLVPSSADFFLGSTGTVRVCNVELADVPSNQRQSSLQEFFEAKKIRWNYRVHRDSMGPYEAITRADILDNRKLLRATMRGLEDELEQLPLASADDLSTQVGRLRLMVYLGDYLGDVMTATLNLPGWNDNIAAVPLRTRLAIATLYKTQHLDGSDRREPLLDKGDLENLPLRSSRDFDFLTVRFEDISRPADLTDVQKFQRHFVIQFCEITLEMGIPFHPYFGQLVAALIPDYVDEW